MTPEQIEQAIRNSPASTVQAHTRLGWPKPTITRMQRGEFATGDSWFLSPTTFAVCMGKNEWNLFEGVAVPELEQEQPC